MNKYLLKVLILAIASFFEKEILNRYWLLHSTKCSHLVVNEDAIQEKLNIAETELKEMLNNERNGAIQDYLEGLIPIVTTGWNLWKATAKIPPIR